VLTGGGAALTSGYCLRPLRGQSCLREAALRWSPGLSCYGPFGALGCLHVSDGLASSNLIVPAFSSFSYPFLCAFAPLRETKNVPRTFRLALPVGRPFQAVAGRLHEFKTAWKGRPTVARWGVMLCQCAKHKRQSALSSAARVRDASEKV
jgi:hypothetical protein